MTLDPRSKNPVIPSELNDPQGKNQQKEKTSSQIPQSEESLISVGIYPDNPLSTQELII